MKEIKSSRKYIRYMKVKMKKRTEGLLSIQKDQAEHCGIHGVK